MLKRVCTNVQLSSTIVISAFDIINSPSNAAEFMYSWHNSVA